MLKNAVVIGFGLSCLLLGETVELPAGGALKLEGSAGDLRIEGWDHASVEITADKPVTTERHGDEVAVTTDAKVSHIFVPRNARLVIHHKNGEILVEGVRADISATVHQGAIGLVLPEGAYDIDTRAKIGGVTSEFAGRPSRRRMLVGHEFVQAGSGGAPKLYLRVGYGDITILKATH